MHYCSSVARQPLLPEEAERVLLCGHSPWRNLTICKSDQGYLYPPSAGISLMASELRPSPAHHEVGKTDSMALAMSE